MNSDANTTPQVVKPRERPGISLDEWYPLVEGVVPTPRTRIHTGIDLLPIAYGEGGASTLAGCQAVERFIRESADELGWPAFLRTGLTSGKHDWKRTCYLDDSSRIANHMFALIEYSATADFLGLPCDVWVVRELLPTHSLLTAFRGDMPITRERRYFVNDGVVIGHHPYWPPDALRDQTQNPEWERVLVGLINDEDEAEVAELTGLTEKVGSAVPGAWSVDWLWVQGNDIGGWYLTDMAHAEVSFVWKEWPTAPDLERMSL